MTTSDSTPIGDGEDVATAAEETAPEQTAQQAPAKKAAAKKSTARKTTTKKATAKKTASVEADAPAPAEAAATAPTTAEEPVEASVAKKATRKAATRKKAAAADPEPTAEQPTVPAEPEAPAAPAEAPAPEPEPEPAAEEPTALSVEELIAASASGSAGAPRTRVIVAEDEALIRLDLVELLRDEGYDVVAEAPDGQVAVEKARELAPDLVVMDVQMPRMDGITAAKIIAGERIAPVVMLTAFSQRELVERAREAGAMAYVVKPFEASDVVPAIEIALARFQEIRAVEAEVEDLEERLASRKAVDQAKGLLQSGMGMTEQEAFRWIQKTAMDLRKPMREVAEGIIEKLRKPKNQ